VPPVSSVPYCTWTLGAWKQTCTGHNNPATCVGTALVDPNSTKPACVDASCYRDLCISNGDAPFFRLGDDNGSYIDFNPCDLSTVAIYGDLYALVTSFMDIHAGTSGWMSTVLPVNHLWHSNPVDTNTSTGTLGAQLVTAMANRALLLQTNGSTATFDHTIVNVSCLLGVPNTPVSRYSIDMIIALANCFISRDPTTVSDFTDMCVECFGSGSLADLDNNIGCIHFAAATHMTAPNYSPLVSVLDDINHYTDNCITNTTLASCFSVA